MRDTKPGKGIRGAGLVVLLLAVGGLLPSCRSQEPTLLVPAGVASAQAALDQALPGTRVLLQAKEGPFQGPLSIHTPGVTLGSSGGTAVVLGSGEAPAITVQADDVTVRDLTIEATGTGLLVKGTSGCVVERVSVREGLLGVLFSGARSCRLIDSSVTDARMGVSLEEGSDGSEVRSSRLVRCVEGGIAILESAETVISRNEIDRSGAGIVLRAAEGTVVQGNRVLDPTSTGILVQDSSQSRVLENRVERGRETGIAVRSGRENAVTWNAVSRCAGTGILTEKTEALLCLGNRSLENRIGLEVTESQNSRLLHNEVSGNLVAGLVVSHSEGALVLDNRAQRNASGIALLGAERSDLSRNRLTGNHAFGFLLLDHSRGNALSSNQVEKSPIGVLLVSSSQNLLTENELSLNGTGLRLVLSGPGTRIEGNTFLRNEIGIGMEPSLREEIPLLPGEATSVSAEPGSESSLLIAQNVFRGSKTYDISNQTDVSVRARENVFRGARSGGLFSAGVIVPSLAKERGVTLATQDTLPQVLLGRLVQLVLTDRGIRVTDLVGLGSVEEVEAALRAGDVDLVWGDPERRETLPSGTVVLPAIASTGRFLLAVPNALAATLPARTVSALAEWLRGKEMPLSLAAPRSLPAEAVDTFTSTYNLPFAVGEVTWTGGQGATETLLRLGTVQAGLVEEVEETLSLTGFTLLEDDRGALPVSRSAPFLHPAVLVRSPEVGQALADLTPHLSTEALHAMATRVRLLQEEPEQAAREFLIREGVIRW
jgi:parallel beta-helix repeat protein